MIQLIIIATIGLIKPHNRLIQIQQVIFTIFTLFTNLPVK